MTNNEVITMSSDDEGNIDRERIVDGQQVPDEYFCPICQYLLWKPRSCSSCQHLFCQKCIKMWIDNSNSEKKCPFRCQAFEERRCPPYVQSLLSRLTIHCRNASFGCTEVVSYDLLEHHERVQCQYLSEKCSECEQLVMLSELNEHREVAGLCVPRPIKCTICQNYIEKSIFREHFHSCCQSRINEHFERSVQHQTLANGGTIPPNNGMAFAQSIMNTVHLFEQQKQLSRLPTSLKGVDEIQRAREQNCSHLYHILLMFKFILFNWSKAPFLIFTLSTGAFIALCAVLLTGYVLFCHWIYQRVYFGVFLLSFFTFLLGYGTSILFDLISDKTMILCFGIFLFLSGCTSRTSLEVFEMSLFFKRPELNILLCCAGILIMKIILLSIRFYYCSMPVYIAAAFLSFINIYFGFFIHRAYANSLLRATNQPLITV